MKMKFFETAREESLLSDYKGQRLGAIAVYKGKVVLAKAHNSNITDTVQYLYNRYRKPTKPNIMEKPAKVHAEIALFKKIRFLDVDFKDISIYVYRELRDGSLAMARPCASCEHALRRLGIRDVYYTTTSGSAHERYME